MGGPALVAEQSPEEIHRLVCAAAVQHRPIAALYDGTRRLLCPHVLGYNQPGEWRVFCYQFGGETKSGPLPGSGEGIWRCLSLKKLSRRGVVGRSLANRTACSPALRGQHRGRRRRLSWWRSAERAVRKLLQQVARDLDVERGDRVGIMPFGADAATLAGGSPAAVPGLIVQDGRRGQRGKNGSAR